MSGHTKGPWRWVDSDSDEPWSGVEYLSSASLRTVEEFGENKTEEREGKNYTSFRLPKFILDSEEIGGDEEAEANARLIAAAPDTFQLAVDFIEWVDLFKGTLPEAQSEAMFDLYRRARRIYFEVDKEGHDASRAAAISRATEAQP